MTDQPEQTEQLYTSTRQYRQIPIDEDHRAELISLGMTNDGIDSVLMGGTFVAVIPVDLPTVDTIVSPVDFANAYTPVPADSPES